ncbi:hypothetical protein GCM10025864_17320 [Luteimicrobium album]|uniref:Uncharacterized protein n=1 Tax=Luteimicrobium album TaxID=1054550 RepID=A0ABQ6I1C8_9MICO|nr:hypothetical protein GCM10025864_17320 [Luteimicrobium album]
MSASAADTTVVSSISMKMAAHTRKSTVPGRPVRGCVGGRSFARLVVVLIGRLPSAIVADRLSAAAISTLGRVGGRPERRIRTGDRAYRPDGGQSVEVAEVPLK